jgi:hypothetical protein
VAANRNPTLRVRLALRLLFGAVAAVSVSQSFAQQPAFIGARAGAVRAAGPGDFVPVVRAAAPDDFGYDEYRNGASRNATQSGTSMIGRAWADVKRFVVGSPTVKANPATAANQTDSGLMPLSPAILPQYANGDPRRANPNAARPNPVAPPRNPSGQGNAFFGGPVMAGPVGVGAPPAMLAGKPAFNWYGYGSAPSAVTPPQGSANWLSQTGATAGAFPHGANRQQLPTTGIPSTFANTMGPVITVPPPSLNPPQLPAPVATSPPANATPALPVLPTITPASTPPAQAATTPVSTTPSSQPRFDNIEEPQWQPAASPSPIQPSSGVETKGGVVPAVATEPAITWTPITPVPPKLIPVTQESKPAPQTPVYATPVPQPIATTATNPVPPVARPAPQGPQLHATVRQASFQQTQPINVISNGGFPPPVKTMIMSDPRKMLELERQIRAACIRTATLIDVTEVTPQTLLVRYVSRSETAARDTARAISQMTTLRPYTIQFDARLADR